MRGKLAAGHVRNPERQLREASLTRERQTPMVGREEITLLPLGFVQFNLAGLFPGVSFPPGKLLTIALDAGTSGIAAYGSIADNISGDLITSPGLR